MARMRLKDARTVFLSLPVAIEEEPLVVTKQGRPLMVAMDIEQYDSLIETLDILSDRLFLEDLLQGAQQAQEGFTKSAPDAYQCMGVK